jgi:hypothetical protein
MIPKVSVNFVKTVVLVGMVIITITDAWKGKWSLALMDFIMFVILFILLVKISITVERND